MKNFISVFYIIFTIAPFIECQKLCNFSDSPKNDVSSFIQHFSTSKCLRVTSFGFLVSSKVVLDECSFWNKATTDQQYSLVPSTLGKLLLKTNAGRGEYFCLTTKQGELYNDYCQSSNFDQNWSFKPVKSYKGQFLIEQYSSKKCIVPKSRATGSTVELVPCNSMQTEQIWKVCS